MIPEECVADLAKRKIIMEIIENSLSEDQYRTIILYYFDEMTAVEIAELMDCHEKTVLYRLKTARAKIKEGVMRYEEENRDKLHAVVPFLPLTQLFQAQAKSVSVPSAPAFPTASSELSRTLEVPSDSAASAAKQGGKTMLNTLKSKIIAGACAAVVVDGGIAAGVILSKGSGKRPPAQVTSTPTVSEPTVSEPDEPSSVPASTASEPVSQPDKTSSATSGSKNIYGKAVEGDWDYQYFKHRNKIDDSAAMLTKYTGGETVVTTPSTIGSKPVKSLKDTFEYNKDIVDVTVQEGVIYLEEGVFNGCKSLKKVNLPGSLKKIGEGAFGDCKSLEYIELPEGVYEIAVYAFKGSSSLKTVILPDSVCEVGSDAFKQ